MKALFLLGVACVLIAALGVNFSEAAFMQKTTNSGQARAASIHIYTNKPSTALFSTNQMAPGDTQTTTILITNDGNKIADPSVSIQDIVDASGLLGAITLQIEQNSVITCPAKTISSFGSCPLALIGPGTSQTYTLVLNWPLAQNSPNFQNVSPTFTIRWAATA